MAETNKVVKADGYFYKENGEFLGKEGNSEQIYLATKYRQEKDIRTSNIKITYEEVIDLKISHSNFCYIAGVIHSEDASSWHSCAAIANATLNMIKLAKSDLIVSEENKYIKGVLATGYSSVPNKIPLKDTEKEYFHRNARQGLIHVLMRNKHDYSNGAILWDGIDFAGKGASHNKARKEGGISITKDLWERFVNVCEFRKNRVVDKKSPYYGKYVLNYGPYQTKDEILKKIPFLPTIDQKDSTDPMNIYIPKGAIGLPDNVYRIESNLYESTGTHPQNNLGRILYKAAAVEGKQIYWRPYLEHKLNKKDVTTNKTDYSFKSLASYWVNKASITIFIPFFILLFSCTTNKKEMLNEPNVTIEDLPTEKLFAGKTTGEINYYDNTYNVLDYCYYNNDTIFAETFSLKNGYNLYLLPVNNNDDVFHYFVRLQSSTLDTIIFDQLITNNTKYLIHYEGMDFSDYFCLNQSGGGYYSYITMYEKKTAEHILYGLKSGFDLDNEMLIFEDQENERETDMTLLDVKKQKFYPIKTDNIDDPMIGTPGSYSSYSISKVTDNNVVIKFDTGEKKHISLINIRR